MSEIRSTLLLAELEDLVNQNAALADLAIFSALNKNVLSVNLFLKS
jgi:hypothetical protein